MRRVAADIDPNSWPAFDARAVATSLRNTFDARKRALELYAASTPLAQILERTGVHRRQLYRLLDHCLAQHEDGRLYGWRGLVPYVHVANYQRVTRIDPRRDGNGAGAAGAFSNLLQAYPALATWISDRVRDKRIALQQISITMIVIRSTSVLEPERKPIVKTVPPWRTAFSERAKVSAPAVSSTGRRQGQRAPRRGVGAVGVRRGRE